MPYELSVCVYMGRPCWVLFPEKAGGGALYLTYLGDFDLKVTLAHSAVSHWTHTRSLMILANFTQFIFTCSKSQQIHLLLNPRLSVAKSPTALPPSVTTPLFSFPHSVYFCPPLSQMDSSQLRMTQTGRPTLRTQIDWKHQGDFKIHRKYITSIRVKRKEEGGRIFPRWRSVRIWTLRRRSCRTFSLQRSSARTMKMKWRNYRTGALHAGANKMNKPGHDSLCVTFPLFVWKEPVGCSFFVLRRFKKQNVCLISVWRVTGRKSIQVAQCSLPLCFI